MEELITKVCEFINPLEDKEDEWKTEGVKPAGGKEMILYHDKETGSHCRLLKLKPGHKGGSVPLQHDCDEFVYILSGGLVNERLGCRYEAGSVAVFPKGTKHGPLDAPVGAMTLELRIYK